MWQAANLIFLLVLATVLYVPFLALWRLLIYLLRVRGRAIVLLLSLPVYVVLLFGWYRWQARPESVFKSNFGFAPPADVRGLQGYTWALGDSGVSYLHFKAGPATVKRVLARGLAPGNLISIGGGDPPPSWWNPPTSPPAQRFEATFTGRSFSSEMEILLYDPTTGDIWFQFFGVD
jgi:hypothetical protein